MNWRPVSDGGPPNLRDTFHHPLFISEKEFTIPNDLCYFDDCIECISIEIEWTVFCTTKNVIVTVIYRPLNTDTWVFNEKIDVCLECVSNEKKLCFLIGDYDINILNCDCDSATSDCADALPRCDAWSSCYRIFQNGGGSKRWIDKAFTIHSKHK